MLTKYRKQIDMIDKKIINLLAKRGEAALNIANIKYQIGEQIYDHSRESLLFAKIFQQNIEISSPFNNIALQNIYKAIIKESRLLQSNNVDLVNYQPTKVIISIQGIKGSFSDQVGKNYCSEKLLKNYHLQYSVSSKQVVTDVLGDGVNYGVVALCNNWGGVVEETVSALQGQSYQVIDTYKLMIKQNLMTLPGIKYNQIKKVYSHQQALAQCRDYLRENYPDIEKIEVDDTAKAAKNLSEHKYEKDAAVIASELSAEYYNLNIIGESIQDNLCNETLFLIITKK